MWESLSTISAMVAVALGLLFVLLLVEKSVYTRAGFYFQGSLLASAVLFGSMYYFVANNKVEINSYQYAQIYNLFMDESKDYIIKKEIRRGLADGMFSRVEYNKLKVNHLEPMNYTDAMDQFAEVLPNIELNYSTPAQKLSVNISISTVYMMRMVFVAGFFLFGFIYLMCWSQYKRAINTKTKKDDKLNYQVIERWHFICSKNGLLIVGLVLSFSTIGLAFTELYFNDVTSITKNILVAYGEANKNIPMIYDAVKSVLADGKVTADEYTKIENLEQKVVLDYVKQSILATD